VGLVAIILKYEKDEKIQRYIQNKTKEHQAMYDAIYHSFKKRADIVYTLIQKDKEVIDIYSKLQNADKETKNKLRTKLKYIINKNYSILQTQGIEIIHFHLKSNESFFRMHKPEKFGDDLTPFRQSIVYTNKYEKATHGFEIGKHFSGYRFVYPLKDQQINKHLGSMEISFNLSLYVKEFMDTLNVLSNFRINKDILDKKFNAQSIGKYYKQSKFSNYYVPKDILQLLDENKKDKIKNLTISNSTVKKGIESINNEKPISIYDIKSANLISFIPVKNEISKEVCGFITIRSDDKYIYNKTLNSYFIFALFAISTLSGLIFIYREIKSQKDLNKTLQEEVNKKTKELKYINENLELKVKNEVDKNIKQEMELFKKAKLAAVGDMIGNIAHQWRQPLAVMSAIASAIQVKHEFNILEPESIKDDMNTIIIKTQYLSETVETFRNYLKEEKEKKKTNLQDRLNMAISITKTALEDNNIKLINNIKEIEPIEIVMVPGELTEVLINIINNAKDILLEKKTKEPWVKVLLEKQDKEVIISIEDNGGGIPENIMPKIFDQYFTTKDDSTGTGLGLHMSKKIIEESLNGKLWIENTQNGAKFFITLPLSKNN
jgi:signal transduction histidine kinase